MSYNRKTCTEENLRKRIIEEREKNFQSIDIRSINKLSVEDLVKIKRKLFFYTKKEKFSDRLEVLLKGSEFLFEKLDTDAHYEILSNLTELVVDLNSYLAEWVLVDEIGIEGIESAVRKVLNLISTFERTDQQVSSHVHRDLWKETFLRLKAEGLSDVEEAEKYTNQLTGNTLVEFAENLSNNIKENNIRNICRDRKNNKTTTQIGNDYATFLDHVIRLGGSFATTNPVLIKIAWDTDISGWNQKVDEIILGEYSVSQIEEILHNDESALYSSVERINSRITMAVVEESCRKLRDIFLLTDGREGYVSLQINPRNHNNYIKMVEEVNEIYSDLEEKLNGVPNVVFKLPATSAGAVAAEKITSKGIGVTITVNFSVFQILGFGEILNKGKALVNFIALMNGRLAFPIRDELCSSGVSGGTDAARWAGVEIARKAFNGLYASFEEGGLGIDPDRVKLLIASLRIYDNWIPDITELWGIPMITLFPNVRRAFNTNYYDFKSNTIGNPTPAEDLSILLKSEIFRQAWWLPGEDVLLKPAKPLSLQKEDSTNLMNWTPITETMDQFINIYEEMGKRVMQRMEHLLG